MANALLQPDILARAEALGIAARGVVEGLRVGDHKSPYRGFSVEFVQHREYVPGDDIRYIDWKSYGRSERYTIKQYEQETNFNAHVILDASRSMAYGEGAENKLAYGKLLAASLAYVVLRQRDSVGLHVGDWKWRGELPPSGNWNHMNAICKVLETAPAQDESMLGPLLTEMADRVRRRGLIFIISDAFDELPGLLKGLQNLRFRGQDVTLFHVLHNDEIEFPFSGNLKFDGLEVPEEIKTRPHLIRQNYLRIFQEYLSELKRNCDNSRIDYVRCITQQPLRNVLSDYLISRRQGKK